MKTALWAAVVVLLLCSAWSVLKAREARAEALARADRIEAEWVAAAERAEELGNALAMEQERTEAALASLEVLRRRADSVAEARAREAAAQASEALASGATLAETLRTARGASSPAVAELLTTAEAQLEDHLEADARTVAAFREQVRALAEGREAEAEMRMAWERRARLAEDVLEAERVACQLCRREVDELRAVRDPGFLEDVWSHGKVFLAGAGAAVLVMLAR